MAKFVKQTSDLAESLNRLQGFAENLISMETNRRIQLGREKEARMVEAYGYMLGNEDKEIADLEASLQSIEQNLQSRGVELKSLSDEHKTISSEELLAAASEGAVELLNARLEDSRGHRESLQTRKTEASAILRSINMFNDALTLADPAHYGDKGIIDAEDVAHAGIEYMEQEGVLYAPEMIQALEYMQTEENLEKLNVGYYDKMARESEAKLTAAESDFATTDIRRERFEIIKKEAAEGVRGKAYPVINGLVNSFKGPINLGKEILAGQDVMTGKSLTTSDVKEKEAQQNQEYKRLGVTLSPWAFTVDQAIIEAQNLQGAMEQAGGGNYQPVINYLKTGYSTYKLWIREADNIAAIATTEEQKQEAENIRAKAETYKADVKSILGIEIDDVDWLKNLEKMWNATLKADELQGEEEIKMSIDMFPDPLIDESDYDIDPLLKEYGF